MTGRSGTPCRAPGEGVWSVGFASDPAEVGPALDALFARARPALGAWPEAGAAAEDLRIIGAEAVNNVIEHGYAGRPGEPVRLSLRLDRAALRLCVFDRGRAIPDEVFASAGAGPAPPPEGGDPADLPEGGWGWPLILTLADRVVYRRVEGWNYLAVERALV